MKNDLDPAVMATTSISEQLAAFAAQFDRQPVPEAVRERARYLMLDSLGIAFASRAYDFAEKAMAGIREMNEGGQSMVIGTTEKLDTRNAILMNGILIHGLDFDDTHAKGVIHATASVLPTVLAVGAKYDRSGEALVTAYILGVEIATRLGSVAKGGFHQVGFHPTGLIGTFGCTMAAGYLMGLTESQYVDALGLALSVGSGSLEFLNDGAWNKRFHPGWAGAAGVTAATMAKHGYQGTRLALEGRFGLYRSYLPADQDYDLALATADLGHVWEVVNVSVKPLPACHFTHAAIDAAIRIYERGIAFDDIARVDVLVPAEVVKTVCEPEAQKRIPANSYEAQFSIPYLVGTGLIKGRLALEDIEAPALYDAQVLDLASRTYYRVDPDTSFPKYFDGEVIVTLKNGQVVREREAVNRGAVDRPLTAEDIVQKYRQNAARELEAERVLDIEKAVLGMEVYSARQLNEMLGC
jgi:2-methylcitrate dehydratase PrpD